MTTLSFSSLCSWQSSTHLSISDQQDPSRILQQDFWAKSHYQYETQFLSLRWDFLSPDAIENERDYVKRKKKVLTWNSSKSFCFPFSSFNCSTKFILICTVPTVNLEKNLLQDQLEYGIMEYLLHKKRRLFCYVSIWTLTQQQEKVLFQVILLLWPPFFLLNGGCVCVCVIFISLFIWSNPTNDIYLLSWFQTKHLNQHWNCL